MRNLIGTTLAVIFAVACGSADPKIVARPEPLSVEPAELTYGAIFVGAHYVKRVRVKNLATDVPVTVGTENLPLGFSVSPLTFTLAPQEEITIEVTFRPFEVRPFEGTISFGSVSGRASVALQVNGRGIPQALDVDTHLDFGDVKVGEAATLPLTLSSQTDAPLDVSIRNPIDRAITVDPTFVELAPRTTETIYVTFKPFARGHATKSYLLDFCEGCPPTTIEVEGHGVARTLLSTPSLIGFDDVALGLTRSQRVRISNVGDFDATIASISVMGDGFAFDATDFPDFLAVGESASMEVSFTAPDFGSFGGTLRIDGEGGERLLDAPMVGSTGGPFLASTPASISFGTHVLGRETPVVQVRLENVLEPGEIELVEAWIEGPGAEAFQALFSGPASIQPSVRIPVVFAPIRGGTFEAELVMRTTFAEQPQVRIPITGTALEPVACTLEAPDTVRFGLVDGAAQNRLPLVVKNTGTAPCPMWNFVVAGADTSSMAIGLPAVDPLVLEPGQELRLSVELAKTAPRNRLLQAALLFEHSRIGGSQASVVATAWVVDGLPVVPGVAWFEPTPVDRASMGRVIVPQAFGSVHPRVMLPSAAFRLFPGQATEIRTAADANVGIVFEPMEEGPYDAELLAYFTAIPEPVIVRLRGEGAAACGSGPCEWPTTTCVASVDPTMWNRVRFETGAPDDASCTWRMTSSRGLNWTLPRDCAFEEVLPQAGHYWVEAIAVDSNGRADRCRVDLEVSPVVAAPGP